MSAVRPARADRPPRTGLLLGSAACAAAFLVLLVLVVVHWSPLQSLDVSVANHLNDWVAPRPALTTFWKVVTTALQPLTFEVTAGVVAAVSWWRGSRWLAIFVVVAIFGTLGLYDLVKLLVGRPRPTVPVPLISPFGSSFPSGHAAMAATGLTLVVLFVRRWLRTTAVVPVIAALAGLAAAAVGFSRLALGAHYASDVLGGWLLSGAWVLAVCAALGARVELPPRISGKTLPAAQPDPDPPPRRSAS